MKIFCDMDGVLADFDLHYFRTFGVRPDKAADNVEEKIRETKDFFLNIPPMEDMWVLWDFIAPHNPTILTGVPKTVIEAPNNKIAWCTKVFGPNVPIICCPSKEKFLYCEPGDILIDDWDKYKKRWEDVGGLFVHHKNAVESIGQLLALGIN